MMRRLADWFRPKPSRVDVHAAAFEIAEKEREVALKRMERERAQDNLTALLQDLLTFQEGQRGDP